MRPSSTVGVATAGFTPRPVQRFKRGIIVAALAAGIALVAFQGAIGQQSSLGRLLSFIPNGVFRRWWTISDSCASNSKGIDLTGPFFQSLGTNGRSCGTCHQASDGMSVAAANVELRFLLTQGTDPIFRPVDGSNCDHDIDVSTVEGRYKAYSLLRTLRPDPALALPSKAAVECRLRGHQRAQPLRLQRNGYDLDVSAAAPLDESTFFERGDV